MDMSENSNVQKEGWGYLYNSPKWHYFEKDGRSLCGRWLCFGNDLEQGNNGSPDNCKACRDKLAKRKAGASS